MKLLISLALILTSFFSAIPSFAGDSLVVYTARKEHLIKPVFDAYTAKTGTEIEYITGKAGPLLTRLKAEGTNTPADLLITVDAGNLWHAANEGLLLPVSSEKLDTNIPAHLKDPQNRWFGLSLRARTIVYNTDKVSPADLSTYEALAGDEWKNRLVLRTSKKVYNQSLVASFIAEHGEAVAEKTVRGWVANLAAAPFSNDTKTMEAVAAGIGDVGIVNTYYYGRLMKKDPALPLALYWPNQNESGVHVNVSGGGVIKHSKNSDGAFRFLEWLSSTEAQSLFADANMEYPANPAVPSSTEVLAWGEFKANPLNVASYGEHQAAAIRLMDRAGYK
ncbi:MAG TPA: extracellular solute-binding protein [Desulfomicrobiaceae bacterium]|nr:extracellular solute-binding protein [Desulfomicrobiaceae bacterium]